MVKSISQLRGVNQILPHGSQANMNIWTEVHNKFGPAFQNTEFILALEPWEVSTNIFFGNVIQTVDNFKYITKNHIKFGT